MRDEKESAPKHETRPLRARWLPVSDDDALKRSTYGWYTSSRDRGVPLNPTEQTPVSRYTSNRVADFSGSPRSQDAAVHDATDNVMVVRRREKRLKAMACGLFDSVRPPVSLAITGR